MVIESVRSYNYIGILFDDRVSFKGHFNVLRAKTASLIFAFRTLRDKLSCPSYKHLFKIKKAKLVPALAYL